jgi:hypothetical protein
MAILYPPGDSPVMMMAIIAMVVNVLWIISAPKLNNKLSLQQNVPQGPLFVNSKEMTNYECRMTNAFWAAFHSLFVTRHSSFVI